MTTSCVSSLVSSWEWKLLLSAPGFTFCSRRQTRRRRRCTFSKYFTKTGMFLVLGVIILAALPPWALCRPLDKDQAENASQQFQVYEHSSDDSSTGRLTSTSRRGSSLYKDEDDRNSATGENAGRFEFRRRIPLSSSNEPDAESIKNSDIYNDNDSSRIVHSFEVIPNRNENKDNELFGGNSSMIVHVIVTSSSSSTSSGSSEFDETENNSQQDSSSVPEESVQYSVSEDDDDGTLVAEPSSESHVSTVKISTTLGNHQDFKDDVSSKDKIVSPELSSLAQSHRDTAASAELELKKLPKSENDTTEDIFSAFYRAFSETSFPSEVSSFPTFTSSPKSIIAQQNARISLPDKPTTDATITTFRVPPSRSDFRHRPSSFQLFQQRRRLFRNRQFLESKFSTTSPSPVTPKTTTVDSKRDSIEETARKLEFLAKKLDKSEHDETFGGQSDKIIAVSSSSSPSLITSTTKQVPFLLSQPSLPSISSFSPAKIAVSVTHSKSVVASSPAARRSEVVDATKQEIARGEVKNNAKSETTFPASEPEKKERIHSSSSYFTRPRPLIKSLPRNKDDDQHQYGNINNKNRGNNNIFPKNFSTHSREEENGVLRKIYESGSEGSDNNAAVANGNEKRVVVERNSNNNLKTDSVNEENFQNRAGKDGGDSNASRLRDFVFALPDFFDATTFRPASNQRRKITRTVSSEIGDPSAFYFNVNVNYGTTPKPTVKAPVLQTANQSQQSAPTPNPVVNWQQPEKVWSEPAKVWGVPAKVWGEPARVWSEPAKVWSQPENVWTAKLEDEMMQSDQPPEERSVHENEEDVNNPQGTFVILGDDENEGDSIDGDLGRPLMLHHFTVPPNPDKQKETVSVSSSVSSSISRNNKNLQNNSNDYRVEPGALPRNVASSHHTNHPPLTGIRQVPTGATASGSTSVIPNSSNSNNNSNNDRSSTVEDRNDHSSQNKKSGKKFGYVIEGANVRKYRVEERTPDGYIVGEYGVLNNQNAFLRGVRYTADGTINPRLIHEALMKFLSLRR